MLVTKFQTNDDLEVGINNVNFTFPKGTTVIVQAPAPGGNPPNRSLAVARRDNGGKKLSASGLCCLGLFAAGFGAAGSAVSGLTGSAILQAAGYDDYNNVEATQAGAAGGVLLFAAYQAVYSMCCSASSESTEEKSAKEKIQLGQIAWSAGLSALSGVLGAAMIGFRDMELGQYAAASALGSAVISTGLAAVSYMYNGK